MNPNLQMSLKTKWFEMTKSGEKTEDYREITPYWYSRLCLYRGEKKKQSWWEDYFKYTYSIDQESRISFITFTQNIMTLGYPSKNDKERILKFEHAGNEIREGREEWGAENGKLYFVIKHGKRIES